MEFIWNPLWNSRGTPDRAPSRIFGITPVGIPDGIPVKIPCGRFPGANPGRISGGIFSEIPGRISDFIPVTNRGEILVENGILESLVEFLWNSWRNPWWSPSKNLW